MLEDPKAQLQGKVSCCRSGCRVVSNSSCSSPVAAGEAQGGYDGNAWR